MTAGKNGCRINTQLTTTNRFSYFLYAGTSGNAGGSRYLSPLCLLCRDPISSIHTGEHRAHKVFRTK